MTDRTKYQLALEIAKTLGCACATKEEAIELLQKVTEVISTRWAIYLQPLCKKLCRNIQMPLYIRQYPLLIVQYPFELWLGVKNVKVWLVPKQWFVMLTLTSGGKVIIHSTVRV